MCGCVFLNRDFLKLYEERKRETGGWWEILHVVWMEVGSGWKRKRRGLGQLQRGISRGTGHCDDVALLRFRGESGALEKPWGLWPAPAWPGAAPVLSAASSLSCNLGGLLRGISGMQIRRF